VACVHYNWEYRQENPTMSIRKGDHADGVLTCHEARMSHREAEVQYHPPIVSSVYGVVAGTTEDCGQGGDGDDMC
jgi:hypothetical protein